MFQTDTFVFQIDIEIRVFLETSAYYQLWSKAEGAKPNTYKRLPIANTLRVRSVWAHGVMVLGVISGATS